MKKLTTILALVLLVSTTAFADSLSMGPVTEQVKVAFKKNFAKAENVNWKQTDEFYFANFQINDKNFFAAYNEKGELLGMSRSLELTQLPLSVTMALEEQYADYKIDNAVTEIVLDGQTSYYVTAEGKTKILKLKVHADGQIDVDERIKKKVLVGTAY